MARRRAVRRPRRVAAAAGAGARRMRRRRRWRRPRARRLAGMATWREAATDATPSSAGASTAAPSVHPSGAKKRKLPVATSPPRVTPVGAAGRGAAAGGAAPTGPEACRTCGPPPGPASTLPTLTAAAAAARAASATLDKHRACAHEENWSLRRRLTAASGAAHGAADRVGALSAAGGAPRQL